MTNDAHDAGNRHQETCHHTAGFSQKQSLKLLPVRLFCFMPTMLLHATQESICADTCVTLRFTKAKRPGFLLPQASCKLTPSSRAHTTCTRTFSRACRLCDRPRRWRVRQHVLLAAPAKVAGTCRVPTVVGGPCSKTATLITNCGLFPEVETFLSYRYTLQTIEDSPRDFPHLGFWRSGSRHLKAEKHGLLS